MQIRPKTSRNNAERVVFSEIRAVFACIALNTPEFLQFQQDSLRKRSKSDCFLVMIAENKEKVWKTLHIYI